MMSGERYLDFPFEPERIKALVRSFSTFLFSRFDLLLTLSFFSR